MAETRVERKRISPRKCKSEDIRAGGISENGIASRRTTITAASNLASTTSSSTKSTLSRMYGSSTETDLAYKVNINLNRALSTNPPARI